MFQRNGKTLSLKSVFVGFTAFGVLLLCQDLKGVPFSRKKLGNCISWASAKTLVYAFLRAEKVVRNNGIP